MNTDLRVLNLTKLAATVLLVGFLGAGCMPIDITKTIKISTSTDLLQVAPGTPIPDDFVVGPVNVCDAIPEEYRDVDQLIPNLLGEVGLSFLADYIKIDALDLVKVAFKASEDGVSFDGITEVSVSMNGEKALLATPGNGISQTEIVLQPDDPISLLALLEDCPEMTGALRGTVPLDLPTRWDNLITFHLKARVGFL